MTLKYSEKTGAIDNVSTTSDAFRRVPMRVVSVSSDLSFQSPSIVGDYAHAELRVLQPSDAEWLGANMVILHFDPHAVAHPLVVDQILTLELTNTKKLARVIEGNK